MKILIIEDELPVAQALELKLRQAGFSTKTVYNGSEAVDLLLDEIFDLIICDLIMPKMDGYTVLAILKQRKLITPIIVLADLSQQSNERYTIDLGAKVFFIKTNTSAAVIITKINQLLNLR